MPPVHPNEHGPLQAVILDWAGTTVDYGSLAPVLAFVEVFRRRGISLSQAEVRAPMGMDKRDHIRAILQMEGVKERWVERYAKAPDKGDTRALYPEFVPLQLDVLANHARPIPGTLEAVAEMRRMGLKIGSTTGYNRQMMDILAPAAARYGYQPDEIVCVSDVPAGRPEPWMALLCAVQLRAYPMAAILKVGDTVADIAEGLNAGMWTVGLALTGNEIGLDEAAVNNLPATQLHSLLERARQRLLQAGAHCAVDGIWEAPPVLEEINTRLRAGERI